MAAGGRRAVLDLFPDSARLDGGSLTLGGLSRRTLAAEFGTPLVVYCEETLRARGAIAHAPPSAAVTSRSERRRSRTWRS